MHTLENGVLEPSEIYFLQPSAFAEKALLYLQHLGVFSCDDRYVVTHPYWESVLLLFMDEGELEVALADEMFVAHAGDAVLIDCRQEHIYHALGDIRFHYIHFAGAGAFDYAELLHERSGSARLAGAMTDTINHAFHNLLLLARAQTSAPQEHRAAVYIHIMLCELAEQSYSMSAIANESVDRAVQYMQAHLTESISLDELSAAIGLSKYHFGRLFRRQTGMTPHRYFLDMRIQLAKKHLMTTHDSIEQIAEKCGFDNASNFIRLFRQRTGMTPTAYRKIPF